MTDDPILRGHSLLVAASVLPAGQREAYLESRRSEDPAAVESALRELRNLGEPTGDLVGAVILPEHMKVREVGTVAGGWRLTEFLGEGGNGRVYRAVRTTGQIQEEGAIKFLDRRPSEENRFQRERQLLANLNHPGIPSFIDAGSEKGIPFVVMQYVSGLYITDYCDVHGLNIRQRVQLFLQLCAVMEYAHRTILHRDLKPENIKVTASGAVQVLDLGLAAILDPEEAGSTPTVQGNLLGTRHYMSPEQLQFEPLSAATDVYSLGAILYRMITGQVPLLLERTDWDQQLLHEDPVPPSRALLLGKEAPRDRETSSALRTPVFVRGGSEARLRRECAGDLDGIVLKALRKNPKDRYESVEKFRQDLERFRHGLAVTARDSGVVERAWKWSVKNPGTAGLLAASSLFIVLVAHFGALRYVEYTARLQDQQKAVRRLRYLTESGLPEIEKALPKGAHSPEARAMLTQIQRDLLFRIENMPAKTAQQLDRAVMQSALRCAAQWIELGDPAAALATISPAIERAQVRYRADPREPLWRHLYAQLLSQRIALRVGLGQGSDAALDAKTLAVLQKSGG